jgi:hypothetical protein
MLGMTPAQTRANGLGNPSLPQLWLTAMLRMLVELVRNVVSTFQMRSFPLKRDWHTPDDEAALPRVKTDTHQETNTAAQHRSPTALILSSAQSARQSKQEGVLATVSHASPSPSVSLAAQAIHLPLLRRWRQADYRDEGELPPSVRRTGGVRSGRAADELVQWTNSSDERPKRKRRAGSPRLCGETEGESHTHSGSVHSVYASPAKAGVQPSSDTKAREAHRPPSRQVWPPAFAGDAC